MLRHLLLILAAILVISHTMYAQVEDMNWQMKGYNRTFYDNGLARTEGIYQIEVYKDVYVAVARNYYVKMKGPGNLDYWQSVVEVSLMDFNTMGYLKSVYTGYHDKAKIYLTKDGTKLYIDEARLRVVHIPTGQRFNDCPNAIGGKDNDVIEVQSLDHKYIAFSSRKDESGHVSIFNTEDSTFTDFVPTEVNKKSLAVTDPNYDYYSKQSAGVKYLSFSASGKYLIVSRLDKKNGVFLHSNFISLDSSMSSYHFDEHCENCIISSDDMTVLNEDGLMDLPRKHLLNKVGISSGWFFLPEVGYILHNGNNASNQYSKIGDVSNAKIVSIKADEYVKLYKVATDNPGRKYIQVVTNSMCSAFVTLSDDGTITSWKIPTNLPKVKYKSSFTLPAQKSYSTWEKIDFSNTTYPYRRNAQYMWNFGDGTTSNEAHPTHIYTQPGTYTVKLISTDLSASKGSSNTLVPAGVAVVNDSSTQTIVIAPSDVEESVISGELVSNITITPNPFNEGTTIHYRLEKSSSVSLKITNIFGEVIVSEEQDGVPSGTYHHSWNGMNTQNGAVPTGMYFCTISTGNGTQTIPLMLMR